MKKIGMFFCVLMALNLTGLVQGAESSRWVHVGIIDDYNGWMDLKTLTKKTYWSKNLILNADVYITLQVEYDCSLRQTKNLVFLTTNIFTKEVADRQDLLSHEVEPVVPDSMAELMLDKACEMTGQSPPTPHRVPQ